MDHNGPIRDTFDRVGDTFHTARRELTAHRTGQLNGVNTPDTVLATQYAGQAQHVSSQSTHVRGDTALTVSTVTPSAVPALGAAASALAQDAGIGERVSRSAAQLSWLADIMQPTRRDGNYGQQGNVMQHLTTARRLHESASVFSTIRDAADMHEFFPSTFSAVTHQGRLQGLMQTTTANDDGTQANRLAIGFIGTHPQNILGNAPTPGVGSAMIQHAQHLARAAHLPEVTLSAEGREAQGFYRNQGFEHMNGQPLQPQDFTHGTLPLRLPVGRRG
ncbi:hypothetical protein [Duganella sp. Dugasp56]|uniref:hypothetical protein n=1 Tax=Duganella sp. Dugasp56 TaxID=3243046 RepID=UPI0039B0E858